MKMALKMALKKANILSHAKTFRLPLFRVYNIRVLGQRPGIGPPQ